jgi:hypothetical protein
MVSPVTISECVEDEE